MEKYVITISRQYGSGGRFIAELLAKELGIPFYDNKLIKLAAKESGYTEEFFVNTEEKMNKYFWGSSLLANIIDTNSLPLNDQVYLAQSKIIKDLAEKGPCVIVGRCADYVLRDNPNCFNIYINSSLESRIKRAVKFYGLKESEAEKVIKKMDKQREAYYDYYTDQNWSDANNYHLCINSDATGIENSVRLIKDFVKLQLENPDKEEDPKIYEDYFKFQAQEENKLNLDK